MLVVMMLSRSSMTNGITYTLLVLLLIAVLFFNNTIICDHLRARSKHVGCCREWVCMCWTPYLSCV